MAVNLCTLLRVHTESGSYSVRLTAYLGVAPLKCHFCLSIQVFSSLSCWWYLSNYTPVSIIKQNPAERCLCAYHTDWHLYVFNRALILSDTFMHIRQQCPCKNNLPWLENSLLQHLGRPQHIPLFPIALTSVVWFLGFSFCQASKLVVASKMIVLSLQHCTSLRALQLTLSHC